MPIYVGTAGWSYPSGAGRWDGIFYPSALKDSEKLSYYAERFDAVEINSSFYRPINPQYARAWAKRSPSHFRFCAKLYNKFTHPRMYEQETGRAEEADQADFDTFRAGLEPLAESGKLGALLAQFPASFKADEGALTQLEDLVRQFSDYPLAVELRHRSWTDDPRVRRLLEDYQVAWVMIDEPKFKTSIRDVPLTSRLGYFRFHGRNYQQWWRGDREERYNYLYPADEQEILHQEVEEVGSRTVDTFVFYNNHYRAKAVVNALQLKARLGQPPEAPLTPELLAEYPELRALDGVGEGYGPLPA